MPECLRFSVREAFWSGDASILSAIRFEIFVEEQGFAAEIEQDGRDPVCAHVLAQADSGEGIGTARLLPDGHLGRVAVRKPYRGQGVGKALVRALIGIARNRRMEWVDLHSQVHAVAFYQQLGFEPFGEIFNEAGAPHRRMVLELR